MEECQVDVAGIVWTEPWFERGSLAYLCGIVSQWMVLEWCDSNILAFRLRYRFEKTARVPISTAMYTKGASNDSLFMAVANADRSNDMIIGVYFGTTK